MHLSQTIVLSSMAILATADNGKRSLYDIMPLSARAVTGAAYQCHADCGYTILDADTAGYCDTQKWKDEYASCLACAEKYDLWPDYGAGVEAAASGCGIDAKSSSVGDAESTLASTSATSLATSVATNDATTSATSVDAPAEQSTTLAEDSTALSQPAISADETTLLATATSGSVVASSSVAVVTWEQSSAATFATSASASASTANSVSVTTTALSPTPTLSGNGNSTMPTSIVTGGAAGTFVHGGVVAAAVLVAAAL